jgi:sigma-E factor negative regulatory protein RseC
MIEESAVVVKVVDYQVWVATESNSACSACQQKSSCSTSALATLLDRRAVPVDSAIRLTEGDKVMVSIDEGLLIRASLLLYMVPLMALFAGAGLADWLLNVNSPHSDLWIAGSAFFSFLFSLVFINKAQILLIAVSNRPVVVRKI